MLLIVQGRKELCQFPEACLTLLQAFPFAEEALLPGRSLLQAFALFPQGIQSLGIPVPLGAALPAPGFRFRAAPPGIFQLSPELFQHVVIRQLRLQCRRFFPECGGLGLLLFRIKRPRLRIRELRFLLPETLFRALCGEAGFLPLFRKAQQAVHRRQFFICLRQNLLQLKAFLPVPGNECLQQAQRFFRGQGVVPRLLHKIGVRCVLLTADTAKLLTDAEADLIA